MLPAGRGGQIRIAPIPHPVTKRGILFHLEEPLLLHCGWRVVAEPMQLLPQVLSKLLSCAVLHKVWDVDRSSEVLDNITPIN